MNAALFYSLAKMLIINIECLVIQLAANGDKINALTPSSSCVTCISLSDLNLPCANPLSTSTYCCLLL